MDEIKELKREGLSIRAISRMTGYDRKTISQYVLAPTGRPVYKARPSAATNLEPFKAYLKERLMAGVWYRAKRLEAKPPATSPPPSDR